MPVVRLTQAGETYEFPVFVFTDSVNGKDKVRARIAIEGDNDADIVAFTMRYLTQDEICKMDDRMMETKGDKTTYKLGTNRRERFRLAVKGWTNLLNEQREQIPFAQQTLDKLPASILKVLDDEIADANGLREETTKN